MRVLYVDLEREWRGGQSQALLTLRGLHQQGHDVELLAAKDSPLAERAAASKIKVHRVRRLGLRAWAARAIAKLAATRQFQVIHLNESHALTAAWMAGAHRYAPLLLSRRIGFPLQKNRISQARFRALTRFVANSKDVARSLTDSGISADRISIVNEGVDIPALPTAEAHAIARKRRGIQEDQFLYGCVSVFVPEKGQRHLIEALAIVRATHPGARLILAGDGKCGSELESLAARLGQKEAVFFPGFVTNVDEVYTALDAFVFPSEFEGLGTALQAAMAMGLPSISTARGALGEVVDDQRTALVVEPNGREFAAAMLRLISDPALRTRLSQAGRGEITRTFSTERMVAKTVGVYEDVLKRWRTS